MKSLKGGSSERKGVDERPKTVGNMGTCNYYADFKCEYEIPLPITEQAEY